MYNTSDLMCKLFFLVLPDSNNAFSEAHPDLSPQPSSPPISINALLVSVYLCSNVLMHQCIPLPSLLPESLVFITIYVLSCPLNQLLRAGD